MSTFASYFPITDPTLIFFVVLLIILLAPIIMGKLRIPHLIGMVLAGVLVGKYGLNILVRDSSFELFGRVGLYYIMFLASLEMDMEGLETKQMAHADLRAPDIRPPFCPDMAHGAQHSRLHTPCRPAVRLCDVVEHPCRLPHRLALRPATTEERDTVGGLYDDEPLPRPCRARCCRGFVSRQERHLFLVMVHG